MNLLYYNNHSLKNDKHCNPQKQSTCKKTQSNNANHLKTIHLPTTLEIYYFSLKNNPLAHYIRNLLLFT